MAKILDVLKKAGSFAVGLIKSGVITPKLKVGVEIAKYIPSIARHLASKLAGVLVTVGVIQAGAAQTVAVGGAEVIGGAILWVGTLVWSFVEKKFIGKKEVKAEEAK